MRTPADLKTPNGDALPIEERDCTEITEVNGMRAAPNERDMTSLLRCFFIRKAEGAWSRTAFKTYTSLLF
ncbi:hypothetical protein [Domibacillus iocasae]|uniref:Uncharacterized protein n=1 Tax=Domibacillus iocasae TaxID=1714016 RepID=A0A1E7DTV8_9BACI|nr:hypothetical protein [Domibacillus iocasae]OES46501.1 hypothetical protein BA724_00105 [Domibacillus iocasae]